MGREGKNPGPQNAYSKVLKCDVIDVQRKNQTLANNAMNSYKTRKMFYAKTVKTMKRRLGEDLSER